MNLTEFFKAIIDSDSAPVVVCDLEHTVVYMNPASVEKYHVDLTGKSIKLCHNAKSNEKIGSVIEWFLKDKNNNVVFTSRNDKENKDVYMVALRDADKNLIGYYEKHQYRNCEDSLPYSQFS